MHKYRLVLLLIAYSVLGFGCGGGDTDSGPENTNTTYVNAIDGLDSPGNGTSRSTAYKTITYALVQPSTKTTIELANGTYDAASGEQFPIVIPGSKRLVGRSIDIDQQEFALITGTGAHISQFVNGASDVAVVFNDALEIRNLVIESTSGIALWVENATAKSVISNLGLANSNVGMTLVGNASPRVLRSRIEQNQLSGIEILGNSAPTFLNNSFGLNGVGVFVSDNARPNFGISSGGGGNSFSGNTLCDFLHSGIESLNVIGTRWDQDVFDFSIVSSCAGGAEIVISGAGSIDYQFIPPKNNLVFQNTNRIPLDQPLFGEIIFTQEPQFVWSGTGPNISMIAVWDRPPVIGTNEILDTIPIYWFWHSGLSTGGNGFVQHRDGRFPLNGSIESPQAPELFEVGRSYYWAVWEWNELGRNIIASSSLSYFRTQ